MMQAKPRRWFYALRAYDSDTAGYVLFRGGKPKNPSKYEWAKLDPDALIARYVLCHIWDAVNAPMLTDEEGPVKLTIDVELARKGKVFIALDEFGEVVVAALDGEGKTIRVVLCRDMWETVTGHLPKPGKAARVNLVIKRKTAKKKGVK